jgi:mono/diheme cytochrome c family protein
MIRSLIGTASLLLLAGSIAFAADGAAIYKAQCAKCHGDTGKADTGVAKAMKVPALAGDANLQKMSEADVAARIKGNAKHPSAIKGLSDEDMKAVAAYVKQLSAK